MIAKKITVTGDVQGVFYRHYTKKEATKLGLVGWTRNEHDGSVTIFAQGEEDKVNFLVEWAKTGSPMATVEKVETEETEVDANLKGFTVK